MLSYALQSPGLMSYDPPAALPGQPEQPSVPGQQPVIFPMPIQPAIAVEPVPGQQHYLPAPAPNPNIPNGLEYLSQIDQILIQQQIEIFEVLTGFETQNKYTICNTLGQQVYFAKEKSDCLTRQCCGPLRPFEMTIEDNMQREVIRLIRPFRCYNWCCFCCLQEVEVQSPPGTTIGWITQDCTFLFPWFSILDADRQTVLKVKGPCWRCRFCDINFLLVSADGTQEIGKITKQWSGLAKEFLTSADNFGVQFPMDLDVKVKATLIGACFLIDFMFFDNHS